MSPARVAITLRGEPNARTRWVAAPEVPVERRLHALPTRTSAWNGTKHEAQRTAQELGPTSESPGPRAFHVKPAAQIPWVPPIRGGPSPYGRSLLGGFRLFHVKRLAYGNEVSPS